MSPPSGSEFAHTKTRADLAFKFAGPSFGLALAALIFLLLFVPTYAVTDRLSGRLYELESRASKLEADNLILQLKVTVLMKPGKEK